MSARGRGGDLESEHDLVERARGGDLDAFELLLRAHADRVLAFLVRWLRNRALAQDAFQEAATRAFLHLDQLRRGASFRAWFVRIAVNRAKTQLARRARDEAREDAGELVALRVAPSSEAQLAAGNTLERALARLSAPDRQVLLLRFAEEMTMAEIAEALGVVELVVKMRVSRARRRFRLAVQQIEEEA
jgi:RNA polymerase sigma-70 factor, ECF subfamily